MGFRLWSYVDFVIIILNIMIGLTSRDRYESDGKIYTFIKKEEMRVYEAIVILFMWFKSLYYL